MKSITVTRTGQTSLRFKGEEIASAQSSSNRAHPNYSGETGISWLYTLYRTEGGTYVAAKVMHSLWQGSSDEYMGTVCASEDEVIAFFGQDWLAHELYEEADIANVELVN